MNPFFDDPQLSYLSATDRRFVARFDEAMKAAGFPDGGRLGPGYCWGRHLVAYAKGRPGSERQVARVYLRDDGITLRLYLSDLDKHRAYLERASEAILAPFLAGFGDCVHCHNQRPDGTCKFRKSYTLFGYLTDKCNGLTFEYRTPAEADIPSYLALLAEFGLVQAEPGCITTRL